MATILILLVTILTVHGMALFGSLGWMGILLQYGATLNDAGGPVKMAEMIDSLTNNFITPFGQLTMNDLLLPIPLFTLAGYLLAKSDAPHRIIVIFQFLTEKFVGKTAFALGVMALIVSAVFTPLTGASGVTIIALGGILYPILKQQGYSERLNLGIITSSGSLGLLFFPSLPVILYGIMSNNKAPIPDLFVWGLLPGALLIILPSIFIIWETRNIKPETTAHLEWSEVKPHFWKFFLEALIVPIIFVLFLNGKIIVSEMGLLTLLYFYILEVVVYREISWEKQKLVFEEALSLLGGILIIIFFASSLTSYMIDQQIPQHLFEWVQGYITSKWTFLIVLNIFLLVVGALMDIFSAIVVVAPLIIPVGEMFGVNMVHLGLLFLTNLEIGYLTPPVGINLFIASFRFKKNMVDIYRSVWQFLVILVIAQVIITYVPLFWLDAETPRNVAQTQIRNIKAGNLAEFQKALTMEEYNSLAEVCEKYKALDKKFKKAKKIKNKAKRESALEELDLNTTPEFRALRESGNIKKCTPELMLKTMFDVREDSDAILGEFDEAQVKNETLQESKGVVEFSNGKTWEFVNEEGHWKINSFVPTHDLGE